MGPDPTETPQDPDPGMVGPVETEGSGCTNGGQPPSNCIVVTANGLHVSKIHLSIRTHGEWAGRWKVNLNGSLFLRSPALTGVGNGFSWDWVKSWTFHEDDELCGGFWKSTGGWFNAPGGCAAVVIHS